MRSRAFLMRRSDHTDIKTMNTPVRFRERLEVPNSI